LHHITFNITWVFCKNDGTGQNFIKGHFVSAFITLSRHEFLDTCACALVCDVFWSINLYLFIKRCRFFQIVGIKKSGFKQFIFIQITYHNKITKHKVSGRQGDKLDKYVKCANIYPILSKWT
jgi:hypothetical protein